MQWLDPTSALCCSLQAEGREERNWAAASTAAKADESGQCASGGSGSWGRWKASQNLLRAAQQVP